MANEHTTPVQQSSNAGQRPQTTEEIVQRHMQDENHVITEEELRNVQIGHSSEPVTTGAEIQARFEEGEGEPGSSKEDGNTPADGQRLTPWDVTT